MPRTRRRSKPPAETPAGRTFPRWVFRFVLGAILVVACWFGGRALIAASLASRGQQALYWGNVKEARRLLKESLAYRPDDGPTLLLAARAAELDHESIEANRLLERADQTLPDDVALERTLFRMRQGDLGDADGMLNGIQSQLEDPQTAIVLEAIIEGSLQISQTTTAERALSLWNDTMKDGWAKAQSLAWQGELAFRQGMPDVALGHLREAVAAAPANDRTRLRLSEVLLQYSPKEAKSHLDYLRKRTPDQRAVLIRLASCHRELGEYREATAILDELLQRSDRDPAALIERGRVALDMLDLHEAERWFRRAEALMPDHREVLLGLARCLQLVGKPDDAQSYRDRLMQLDNEGN